MMEGSIVKSARYASTILGALSALHPGLALADPATPDTVAEVIVTAQRRSEDVKTVPASISVLGGAALEADHITGLEDISRATPGVSFTAGGAPGMDAIEMRGVSSTSGSATTGIYLDDVSITTKNIYLNYGGAVEPKLFDMDRVEILRGPQGTLYGSSSEGGAIRFISNPPDLNTFSITTSTLGSETRHGGGNYDEQVVVNQPLLDGRAAVRFGVDVGEDSGYIYNLSLTGQVQNKNVNDDRWAVARISAKFEVDDSLTITPSIYAEWDKTRDVSVSYLSSDVANFVAPGAPPITLGHYEQTALVPQPGGNQFLISSVTVTKELGFAQLSSISSFFIQNFRRTQDGTYYDSVYFADDVIPPQPGGYNPNGYTSPLQYKIAQLPAPGYTRLINSVLTQEFRLTSTPSATAHDKMSWVAGLYISDYTTHLKNTSYVHNFVQTFTDIYGVSPANSTVATFAGETFTLPGYPPNIIYLNTDRLREEQYAAYGDLTYSPIPRLKLTAGLRYSYAPGSLTQYQSGYFALGAAPEIFEKTSFDTVTPKFSLTYDATKDVTTYLSVGQGNRLGGGNYYIPTSVCAEDLQNLGLPNGAPTTYNSDSLWSYEGGLKGRFLNNTLSIDAGGYYVEWSNIQQTINLPICGDQMTVNIGNAVSYGPELEVNYRPVRGLILGLSYSNTHAVVTKVNPQWSTLGVSTGEAILNVPEWMASLRIDYSRPFTNALVGFARADWDLTGPSHGEFNPADVDYEQPEYFVVNASFGVKINARYEASVFAKNLLDNDKAIQIPALQFLKEYYTLRPVTVGVLVKAKF